MGLVRQSVRGLYDEVVVGAVGDGDGDDDGNKNDNDNNNDKNNNKFTLLSQSQKSSRRVMKIDTA